MATGMARGAKERGKRIAFGDGKRLLWDHHSADIFRDNPNICRPGNERASNTEWIKFHRGHRVYNSQGTDNNWIWNYDFKAIPGEIYLSREEEMFAKSMPKGFVLIEPNGPVWKGCWPNKEWPVARYEEVTDRLVKEGYVVVQLEHGGRNRMKRASMLPTSNFRRALAVMSSASLYIGPEGGLHHGAAATKYHGGNDGRVLSEGIPAVVLFGGFIPPEVTGYDTHTNLTGSSTEACGSNKICNHCLAAMRSIEVEEVMEAALSHLGRKAA